MVVDFDKCRKENNLNSLNLSNMARGALILKDCDIASYPCSNQGPSSLVFQISNLYEIMRTFDIRYENGFFHRSLVKAVRNGKSKQMKN